MGQHDLDRLTVPDQQGLRVPHPCHMELLLVLFHQEADGRASAVVVLQMMMAVMTLMMTVVMMMMRRRSRIIDGCLLVMIFLKTCFRQLLIWVRLMQLLDGFITKTKTNQMNDDEIKAHIYFCSLAEDPVRFQEGLFQGPPYPLTSITTPYQGGWFLGQGILLSGVRLMVTVPLNFSKFWFR